MSGVPARSPLGGEAGLLLLSLLVGLSAMAVSQRLGTQGLLVMLVLLPFLVVLAIVSLRFIQVPLLVWVVVLMGFRPMLFIPTPGLPDITLDRVTMIWLVSVFVVKLVSERRSLRGPWLPDILIASHGLYLLFSCLLRNPAGFNIWTKSYLMAYTAYFLGKNLTGGSAWYRRVAWFMVAVNLYHGFTSIAEHFHWNSLVWPKFILDRSLGISVLGRSRGVFLQPAVLGTAIAMVLPIHLGLLRVTRAVAVRLLLVITLPLLFLGLYYTYTRGNWVAAAAGLIALAAVGFRSYGKMIGGIVLVGFLVLGTGLINLKQDKFLVERMESEHTVTGRINTMATALRVFRDNPLFGCGFFRYNSIKREYRQTIKVPFFGVIRRSHDIEASLHDIYLGPLAEEGLVGVSLQMGFLFVTFRTFRRKYRWRHRGDPFARDILPVIAAVAAAYFAGGISFDYRYFTTITSLFFFHAGILHGARPETAAATAAAPATATARQRLQVVPAPGLT